MKCNREDLYDYIENKLEEDKSKLVEDHIKHCEKCADILTTFKLMEKVGESNVMAPVGFTSNIISNIDENIYENKKYIFLNKIIENKRKITKYSSVAAVALIITGGALLNHNFNIFNNTSEGNLAPAGQNSKADNKYNNIYKDASFFENTVYEMGEEVYLGDYIYKINSVVKTKTRGNFPTPTNWTRFSFDKEGNLIDDNSYVVVNITIKNTTEEAKELYINNNQLTIPHQKEYFPLAECISSSKLEGYERKDYFRVELDPKEEHTWDLVYACKDEYLKEDYLKSDNLVLEIHGAQVRSIGEGSGSVRRIKIKYQQR